MDCAARVLLAARPILWKVLKEGGAFSDSKQLHPVADPKDRDSAVNHETSELKVEVLLLPGGADSFIVCRTHPEPLRVEVVTPGKHEGIDAIHERQEVTLVTRGGDGDRDTACTPYTLGVAEREGEAVTGRPLFEEAIYGDKRSAGVHAGILPLAMGLSPDG